MYAMATRNVTPETINPRRVRTGSNKVDLRMARRNYCFGMTETISRRLQDLYARREEFIPSDCKALIVIKNDGLAKFFQQQFPNAIAGRRIALKGDVDSYRRGQADGRTVNLTRPIAHSGLGTSQIG
jgi:hypothetical protein